MIRRPDSKPKVNTSWFKQRLVDRGVSMRGLAKKMSPQLDVAAVSLMLRGVRKMQLQEAEQVSKLLNVPLSDVLKNAGIKTDLSGARTVPVVGWVSDNKEAHLDWSADSDHIEGPRDLPADVVAVQVRAPSSPADGEILFLQQPSAAIGGLVGRKCLIGFDSDLVVVGYLRRGYRPGLFNVWTDAGATVADVSVKWAAPILWIKTA